MVADQYIFDGENLLEIEILFHGFARQEAILLRYNAFCATTNGEGGDCGIHSAMLSTFMRNHL